MKRLFSRLRVGGITYDGDSKLECFSEKGQKFIIRGTFRDYGVISPYGSVKNATFEGILDIQGASISVKVHFSEDQGVILEKARPLGNGYLFIEANSSFAVFFYNGHEEVMTREPDAPWDPESGTLYGRIDGPLLYFTT